MIRIIKPTLTQTKLLSNIAKNAFLVPHGHSAPKKDIENYVDLYFNEDTIKKELENTNNVYYLIYYQDKIAGFSKIVFNTRNNHITAINCTQMNRLYLLKEFYGLGLGTELFNFNVQLAKQHQQAGIWLAVWVENFKAIAFYKKMGFKKVGNYDFKISETHSNPNHIMYLEF